MPVRAESAVACRNILGEGLVWCARRRTLYWTDIPGSVLYEYEPISHRLRQQAMPERLACIALCETDGWLLLGFASRLTFWHIDSGRSHDIGVIASRLSERVNDGACDREGRFVFGTMDESRPQRPIGSYYRVNTDLSIERLPLPQVTISNSTAFSPDGRTLYFCDSPRRQIMATDYGRDGRLGEPRVFVDLQDIAGVPDGSCIDSDGGLWNAQWGMRRVVRYTPDGALDQVVEIPASQATKPAFGGPSLDTLFMTSAREGLEDGALQNEPDAGNLWRAHVAGAVGYTEARFRGLPESARRHG